MKFHAIAAGSTLVVKRISPLPETVVDEPIVGNAQTPRLAFIVFSIQFLYLGVAGLVAARGRSSGSLQLAWLLTLIVLLINNTTPAWPTWLVLANGLGGGAIAVATFVCACDFASRFAGDPDVAWARRYRAISLAIGAVVLAIHMNVEFGSFFTPSTPTWVQNVDLGALVAQTIVLLVGLWLAFVKAPEAERQRALWVVTAIGVGIIGFVGAVLAEFAGITEPLRDIPLLLLLAMPLGCAYAILRYRLLDIAFVVNRATVFGLTSLLVLAALALVDYGLQNLLGSWLLRTGIYVQLGLALAIGIA
ncbi:MAG: hypothetical protein IAI50_06410, partial [Candidatus Eremiobacteraeota bacterium]|nr:hypothetical protein [Candidatus Eremiobacteraeota bacterium]